MGFVESESSSELRAREVDGVRVGDYGHGIRGWDSACGG